MYKTARQKAHLAKIVAKPAPTQLELFKEQTGLSDSALKIVAFVGVVCFLIGLVVGL